MTERKNNKHQRSRCRALDKCLRNRTRHYYIEDLVEACKIALEYEYGEPVDVSRRTVINDMNYMESNAGYQADIERIADGRRKYYRYADPDFSIEHTPLTDDEMQKLQETVLMLSRFRSQFPWMEDLLIELQTKFRLDGHTESVIGFDTNIDIKGIEWIEPLFQYIVNGQTVEMTYQPFDKPQCQWTLHPYYIKQYNNCWFLFARNDKDGKIINAALDRIVSVSLSGKRYIPNTDIDFSENFDDVIGVTIPLDEPQEQVSLKFSSHRLPYVLSKPLHLSQKVKDREQGIVEITVIPNRELEARLLSFGSDVEVLAPASLRNQIQAQVQKMRELYDECK